MPIPLVGAGHTRPAVSPGCGGVGPPPIAMPDTSRKTVAACESQPLTALGLRCLIDQDPGLEFLQAADSPGQVLPLARDHSLDVLILDKSFGTQAILKTLDALQTLHSATSVVVWGLSITGAEALRFLQAGARGVLLRSAVPETLLACLRAVAHGETWVEPKVTSDGVRLPRRGAPALTSRERQVLELVARGMKNREIGAELGIRPGTVKVHLKHIFEKTGTRGRYGLALSGLEPPLQR